MNIKISKNLVPFFLVVILGFLFVIFGINSMISKITQKVILEIKSDYTPGPYTPGFDPDKIDPKLFKKNSNNSSSSIENPDSWNDLWNASR